MSIETGQNGHRRHRPRVLAGPPGVFDQRLRAIHSLGGACKACGHRDYQVLEISYVNEDVWNENIWPYWSEIARGERLDEFQLLCANCFKIKQKEAIYELVEQWMDDYDWIQHEEMRKELIFLCLQATKVRPSPVTVLGGLPFCER